jgi:putative spermidine/putrescine transport system permease protein
MGSFADAHFQSRHREMTEGPRARRLSTWLALAILPLIIYGVLYALPIYDLVRSSFNTFDPLKGTSSAFQTGFYRDFLTDTFYLGVLWRTVRISVTVTMICALGGFPMAYFLARSESGMRSFLLIVLLIPLVTSPVVVAYGWLVLLGTHGIVNDLLIAAGIIDMPVKLVFREFTLVLGLVYVSAAFMVLATAASLKNLDWNLVLAARSLGATGSRAFWLIVVPASLPGLTNGCLIVFSLSMSAYAVPALIAGPQVKVMSELIYQQGMALLNWPFAACMSVILVAATTGVLAVSDVFARLRQLRVAKRSRSGDRNA